MTHALPQLFSYFCIILNRKSYTTLLLLCLYLWALIPKDSIHEHHLARDQFHSQAEHCDNVVYQIAVSDAHKCEHKYHLHGKPTHCFACDSHFTSLHTHQCIVNTALTSKTISVLPVYVLPLQNSISSSIYNKGPPLLA
ncbi:MAG: hypothetical protein NTW54_02880 [Bacteroidetes bacterium]|nr:hypothetical protein [Bacteroidota bacterium]